MQVSQNDTEVNSMCAHHKYEKYEILIDKYKLLD